MKKKKHEEAIPLEPVRKSRRLQGAAPEFIPDDFVFGEAKPFIPASFEKEEEAEKEGTIVFFFIIFILNSHMMVVLQHLNLLLMVILMLSLKIQQVQQILRVVT